MRFKLLRNSHWKVKLSITTLLMTLAIATAFVPNIADAQSCRFDRLMIREIRANLEQRTKLSAIPDDFLSISQSIDKERSANGLLLRRTARGRPQGFFLAFPGNAQTAAQIVEEMRPFADAGFDVYAFDYIHLVGPSPLPRLADLVSDAKALVRLYVQDSRYRSTNNVLYGASTGGLLLSQAVKNNISPSTKVIFDSVPDRIPRMLFCDEELNPIEAVNEMSPASGALLVLNGRKDQKVLPANSRGIAESALKKGGCHVVLANGSHPFESDDLKSERIKAIMLHAFEGCSTK